MHLFVGMFAYRMQAEEYGDLDAATIRLLKQIGSGGANIDAVRLNADLIGQPIRHRLVLLDLSEQTIARCWCRLEDNLANWRRPFAAPSRKPRGFLHSLMAKLACHAPHHARRRARPPERLTQPTPSREQF